MAELRQRAVKWTDADWQTVQQSAKSAGKTAAEWVRERTTAGIDGEAVANLRAYIETLETRLRETAAVGIAPVPSVNTLPSDDVLVQLAQLTVERDAALKLAKLAETNVAEGDYGLGDLAARIAERASEMDKTPADWVRSFVQFVLDGKKVMPKQDGVQYEKATEKKTAESDARAAAILEESARRQAAHIANGGAPWPTPIYGPSRWQGVTVAPKEAPNIKWKPGEVGPPNWLIMPTTKPGTTKLQVIDVLIEEIEAKVGTMMKRDAKRNEKQRRAYD